MERVKFTYEFDDEEFGHAKEVNLEISHESIHLDDVCEMFEEFISSTGYSVDGLFRYFKE